MIKKRAGENGPGKIIEAGCYRKKSSIESWFLLGKNAYGTMLFDSM